MGVRNVTRDAEVGHSATSRLHSEDTQLSRKRGGGTSCQRLKASPAGSRLMAHSCFLPAAGSVVLGQSLSRALPSSLGTHFCIHSLFPSAWLIYHFTQACCLPTPTETFSPSSSPSICPSISYPSSYLKVLLIIPLTQPFS